MLLHNYAIRLYGVNSVVYHCVNEIYGKAVTQNTILLPYGFRASCRSVRLQHSSFSTHLVICNIRLPPSPGGFCPLFSNELPDLNVVWAMYVDHWITSGGCPWPLTFCNYMKYRFWSWKVHRSSWRWTSDSSWVQVGKIEGSSFRSVRVGSGQVKAPCLVSNSQVRCLPGSKRCLQCVFRQWWAVEPGGDGGVSGYNGGLSLQFSLPVFDRSSLCCVIGSNC